MTTDHPTFDQLSELADGIEPTPDDAATTREHCAACAECAARLAAVVQLAARASQLPREVAPPAELWAGIRSGLAPRALPSTASSSARPGAWQRAPWLAAAGLVIAVGSSLLTATVLRSRGGAVATTESVAPSTHAAAGSRLPARVVSAEAGYARSVDALRRTLDERRDSLATSTVETVERSLRVADSAIAEAREALERDPANGLLAGILASNYERKIDLLRRATELAPRT